MLRTAVAALAVIAVTVPLGTPVAAAKNGDTHITSVGLTQTVDCNDATLFVNGSDNIITAVGNCWAVTIQGSGNTVVADNVINDITVYGFNQTALYKNGEPVVVEYARSFFPVILIVLVVRSFLFEPFRIPSNSMMPTLMDGDFIFVSKFAYGLRLPVLNTRVVPLGEPQRGPFRLREQLGVPPGAQGRQLLVGDARLHRPSVMNLQTRRAAVDQRDPGVDQLHQRGRQPGLGGGLADRGRDRHQGPVGVGRLLVDVYVRGARFGGVHCLLSGCGQDGAGMV